MDLYFSAFERLLDGVDLGDSGYVYLLGPDYELICHNRLPLIQLGLESENTDLIRKNVIGDFFDEQDGRERFVVVETVDGTRWRLVGVAYMDEVTAARERLVRMVVMFLAAGILMALSAAILLGTGSRGR